MIITALGTRTSKVAARSAGITMAQEHLVTRGDAGEITKDIKDNGKSLIFGPLDPEQGRPDAGVGVCHDLSIRLVHLEVGPKHRYTQAHKTGRVAAYVMNTKEAV